MEFLVEYGLWGVFIGSFLAATLIPLSSELLLMGYIAIGGGEVVLTVISATAGNWLGGMSSYYIGRWCKWETIERWLRISIEKIERQRVIVARYGVALALLTWLPLFGDIFAVSLGFYKVNVVIVSIFMLIGRALRFVLWAWLIF